MNIRRNVVRTMAALAVLAAFCLGLSGCAGDGIPKEVKEVYTAYREACKTDMAAAVEYCYFENPMYRQMTLESPATLQSFEIKEWIPLSDSVWAVHDVLTHQDGRINDGCSFVILLDGNYWAVPGVAGLPDELVAGIDLTPYLPTDEDIMLPPD